MLRYDTNAQMWSLQTPVFARGTPDATRVEQADAGIECCNVPRIGVRIVRAVHCAVEVPASNEKAELLSVRSGAIGNIYSIV